MQTYIDRQSRILGGGTAGLTIAARLTENPEIAVLVLEAGNDHSDDVTVLAPGLFTGMYGNPEYDWDYKTIPQVLSCKILSQQKLTTVASRKQSDDSTHPRKATGWFQCHELLILDACIPRRH